MAPKRSNTSLAVDPSSDDDTSAFQVVQRPTPTKSPVAQAPADLESAGFDERGAGDEIYSSDEIGENGAVIKRQLPPKRMAVAKIPMKNAPSPESSPLKGRVAKFPPRKKKAGKAAAPASPPPQTRNAAAAQRTRSPSPEKAATAAASDAAESPPRKKAASEAAKSPQPKNAASTEVAGTPPPTGPADKVMNVAPSHEAASPAEEEAATAAASEAAKSPPPNKVAASKAAAKSPRPKKAAARTEIAGTPPPTGPADKTANVAPLPDSTAPAGEENTLPQLQEGQYDAEKHFKEKSRRYWYLWQMVLTLEAEHFLSLKGAFLKMDDTKANILNTEIKKLYVQEMKEQLWWKNTEKDVTKMLIDLIE